VEATTAFLVRSLNVARTARAATVSARPEGSECPQCVGQRSHGRAKRPAAPGQLRVFPTVWLGAL
jgi:hypothetical protein